MKPELIQCWPGMYVEDITDEMIEALDLNMSDNDHIEESLNYIGFDFWLDSDKVKHGGVELLFNLTHSGKVFVRFDATEYPEHAAMIESFAPDGQEKRDFTYDQTDNAWEKYENAKAAIAYRGGRGYTFGIYVLEVDSLLKPRTFFRVGHIGTSQGLWYDKQGGFTGFIHSDFKFCKHTELPMDFDPELVGYQSATASLKLLGEWFPTEDVQALQNHGYRIEEYEATDYRWYERFQHHVINEQSSRRVARYWVDGNGYITRVPGDGFDLLLLADKYNSQQ